MDSVQAMCQGGEAAAVFAAELGEQRGDVLLHRARRQEQASGDLAVGEAVGEQVQYQGLAGGDTGGDQAGWQSGVGRPPPWSRLADRFEEGTAGR